MKICIFFFACRSSHEQRHSRWLIYSPFLCIGWSIIDCKFCFHIERQESHSAKPLEKLLTMMSSTVFSCSTVVTYKISVQTPEPRSLNTETLKIHCSFPNHYSPITIFVSFFFWDIETQTGLELRTRHVDQASLDTSLNFPSARISDMSYHTEFFPCSFYPQGRLQKYKYNFPYILVRNLSTYLVSCPFPCLYQCGVL